MSIPPLLINLPTISKFFGLYGKPAVCICNDSKIEDIYKRSSLNLLIVGCFLFLLIWCNLDFIYQIIPRHEVYETGKWVVLMVGISKIIDMGTGLNSEILINSKFYRYDLLFYIVLAVSVVVGNLIFIPLYSYNGAALAALMALALYNTIKFIFMVSYIRR